MSFTEWTVLPHQPIEKLASNLWSVSGTMPKGSQRRMTIARLRDGRLIVHNAVALDPNEMRELDAFGSVAAIVVPNGFHRQDARIWKNRYPAAKVYCPSGARAKVEKLVPVEGDYDAIPSDDTMRAMHLDGMRGTEGVLQVNSEDGSTLVFNDAILNVPIAKGFMGFFLAPTGKPSVPRFTRWMLIKDKLAFRAHLGRLANDNPRRVIVGHGATIDHGASEVLRGLTTQLGQ